MDEIDIAQRNQERIDRENLRQYLDRIPRCEAAKECEDCGDNIPEKRREKVPGCTRCIRCQQLFERYLKERR